MAWITKANDLKMFEVYFSKNPNWVKQVTSEALTEYVNKADAETIFNLLQSTGLIDEVQFGGNHGGSLNE